ILPFIEQDALYRQFKLNEPWDSAHNKKLLAMMPRTYKVEGKTPALPNETFYQGFVGKGAGFEGKRGLKITDFTDGTSNTLMIVEGATAVPWSKPDDIPFEVGKKVPPLGGVFENGFNAALCDGSVRFISKSVAPKTLEALITRNGGEVIPGDF